MLFNSPLFLFLFLPATVAAYIVLRQIAGPRAVLGLLLLSSLFFYGWWNPIYVPLLFGLAVFNFLVARGITAARQADRSDWVSLLLTFGIVADLAVFGYFKYTDFFLDTANALFRTNFILQHILLPLGISFFIFQKIAYLVDTSRGEVKGHDFLEYCFVVMFFPQLLAGPITHHDVIFSQIKGPWAFAIKPSNFMLGLTIFVIGLFKKVVLADSFPPIAHNMFSAAAAGEPVRDPAAAQFQFALPRPERDRLLAALAHDTVTLSARLCLHPARRQPGPHAAALFQPVGHAGPVRAVARRGLAFRAVGQPARRQHGRQPCLASGVAADQPLVVAHRGAARHVFRARPDPGHLPLAVARGGGTHLPRHVQSADFMAGCVWSARLAGRPLRRPAG